jgi:hypothetical protein
MSKLIPLEDSPQMRSGKVLNDGIAKTQSKYPFWEAAKKKM